MQAQKAKINKIWVIFKTLDWLKERKAKMKVDLLRIWGWLWTWGCSEEGWCNTP